MSTLHRQRVIRADGRAINVIQRRAHLSYCFSGCCCGRTERGYAAVPAETFKDEWLKRKLRKALRRLQSILEEDYGRGTRPTIAGGARKPATGSPFRD